MAGTGPRVAKDPLELLNNQECNVPSLLSKYYNPIAVGFVGFLAVCVGNWATKRPVFSGIQKHIGVTAAFTAFGKYLDDRRNETYATRDAVFRHYIELHPEDFPPYQRVLYKDVFEEWIPIR